MTIKRKKASLKLPRDDWRNTQQASIDLAVHVLKFSKTDPVDVYEFVIGQVLDKIIWKYSEAYGRGKTDKYCRNPLWSKDALAYFKIHGFCTSQKKCQTDAIRFEHIVPREILRDYLLRRKRLSRAYVRRVLKLSVGAIVTEGENGKLRKIDKELKETELREYRKNPLIRYQKAKIRLCFNPYCPANLKRRLTDLLMMS